MTLLQVLLMAVIVASAFGLLYKSPTEIEKDAIISGKSIVSQDLPERYWDTDGKGSYGYIDGKTKYTKDVPPWGVLKDEKVIKQVLIIARDGTINWDELTISDALGNGIVTYRWDETKKELIKKEKK